MKNILMILFCVLLGSAGQLSLKHGLTAVGRFGGTDPAHIAGQFVRAFMNPFVLGGFLLYGISSLVWMMIISRVPLSLAYPMISIGYVVVVVLSRVLFHEHVSAMRFAGTLVICAGVVLISRS